MLCAVWSNALVLAENAIFACARGERVEAQRHRNKNHFSIVEMCPTYRHMHTGLALAAGPNAGTDDLQEGPRSEYKLGIKPLTMMSFFSKGALSPTFGLGALAIPP